MIKHNYWTSLPVRDLGVFPRYCSVDLSSFHYIVWVHVNRMRRLFHYKAEERNLHNGFVKQIQRPAIISGRRFTLLSHKMTRWDPAPVHPFAIGSRRWIQSNKSNYNKQRLMKMNRQRKQRGVRLQWMDDGVFLATDTYLPAITNLQSHLNTKVEGSYC